MRTPLFLVTLLLPTAGFAQSICYSPSDCVAPQRCSSLLDGIVPGTCGTGTPAPVPVPEPEVKKYVPPVITQPKKVEEIPTTPPPSSSSASSSSSTTESSAASSQAPALDTGMFSSMLNSLTSMMNSMMNSMTSMLNSMKCMFGGCK